MKRGGAVLAALLCLGILTLWVQGRWAWGALQLGIFALGAWRLARSGNVKGNPGLIPLGFAALWPVLQVACGSSISPADTWESAVNWFTWFLVFALASDLLRGEGLRPFLTSITLFGLVLAVLSTAQKYSAGGRIFWYFDSGYVDDVLGPFVNRNHYAAWIELLLPVALYLAATSRRLRPLYGVAAAVMFGTVIASASRAGCALVCAETIAAGVAVAARGKAPRRALAAGIAQFVVMAAVAVAAVGWQDLQGRLQAQNPEALRKDALRASVLMVRERPFLGSGLGTWSTVYPRYSSFDAGVFLNQAHNDWMQWASEGGLPFVGLLLIFAALLCKPAFQSIYGVGTMAFLIHALVDYPMQQRPALAAWFFALAGASWAWRKDLSRRL